MRIDDQEKLNHAPGSGAEADLKEIVMGLHWHPQERSPTACKDAANLDALCVLLDEEGRVLEVVHPGHARNANSSVVHTGDSPNGASGWDDERIFVFLDALPETVSGLAFIVASVTGRSFGDIPGASCHVSDRVTERELFRLDLTTLAHRAEHCAAAVFRHLTGWTISWNSNAAGNRILRPWQRRHEGRQPVAIAPSALDDSRTAKGSPERSHAPR